MRRSWGGGPTESGDGACSSFVSFTSTSKVVLFAGALLFALGNGLSWPTFQARISGAAEPSQQGALQGAASSAASLASIVGLVLGGALYDVAGARSSFWRGAVFVVLMLGSGVLFAGDAATAAEASPVVPTSHDTQKS